MAPLLRDFFKRVFGSGQVEQEERKSEPVNENPGEMAQAHSSTEIKQSDCVNNPAFVLLLSKFTFANYLGNLGNAVALQKALKIDLSLALKQLLAEGFLQPAELVSIVQSAFGSSELKALAKQRGLPASGTKDVLAKRLVQEDADGMANLVKDRQYFVCSEKGRDAVQKFEAQENERKRKAEKECLEALQAGQLKEACLKVAVHESSKVYKRGVGIDWENYNPASDLSVLRYLFSGAPSHLKKLPDEKLLQLRVAAGMILLWGANDPRPWLSGTSCDEVGLDSDVATMMLLSNAQHHERIASMKAAGIKKVEIAGSGLEVCEECWKHQGMVYDINKVPDIPFEKCTCENGYKCIAVAKL